MPAWISTGFSEYAHRMPRESRIELVEIKPATRSGDKGDLSNIAVLSRKPDYLPYIWAQLTPEAEIGRAHV